jgi:hypothetical protein
MTDLVYIGGYGRSGSPLLESLLATNPNVLVCGEVVCCLRRRTERNCTCGESRYDCVVWSHFYKTPGQLRGWTHKSLILALLEQTSGHYGLLIDSSKTAWGVLSAPFMLRRNLGLRFHLIHLVRDPRGVCWSSASGAWKQHAWIKNRYLRYLRTALGWWAANLSCELFAKFYPDQYSRVRYEDLVESHVATLDRPFAALHTETIAPPLQTSTAANRHQLYGNHGRYNELRSSEIREDSRWRAEMPSAHRAWGAMISWPLRLSYGY